MAIKTEGLHTLGYLISEAENNHSRDQVTLLAGSGSARTLTPGMVLGAVTAGAATAAAVAANTGNGTCGAVTLSAGAMSGVYKLTIIEPGTNVGAFVVEDPLGVTIGHGTVASAFSAGGLAFTLADGSTDFAAGDQFTITVAVGSKKMVQMDLSGTDGRQNAAGILCGDGTDNIVVPNGTDVVAAAHVRQCQVHAGEITWPSGATTDQKNAGIAQLALLGIIVR